MGKLGEFENSEGAENGTSFAFDPSIASNKGILFPSDLASKSRGWDNVAAHMGEVLSIGTPGQRLLRIHSLVVPPAVVTDLPREIQAQFEIEALVYDRPDGHKLYDSIKPEIRGLLERGFPSVLATRLLIEERLAKEARKNSTVELDARLNGALRSYGVRTIRRQAPERVFAGHMQYVGDDKSDPYNASPGLIDAKVAYYGLTSGLDVVYQSLSDKFQSIPVDTPAEWARREAFFQLMTNMVHPFPDANSRALLGFLAASAQERGATGLSLRDDPGKAHTLVQELIPISNEFMEGVYTNVAQLPWIEGSLHTQMVNPRVRADYMSRLRRGLETEIDYGVQGPIAQRALIHQASQIIREAVNY